MSKFLEKLESAYKTLEPELPVKNSEENDIADEFEMVHSYIHPSSNKKCYCMMRKHDNGYNIADFDEEGNLVVDVFGPSKPEENAENLQLTPDLINTVKNLAGGQAQGSRLNPFDNPEKAIKTAYGTLLNKLAKKVKDLSNKIK